MCDDENILVDNSSLSENFKTLCEEHSRIQKFCFKANGISTDIVFSEFNDKLFVVITQYQKIGTFILVSKGLSKKFSEDYVYDVKTIGGLDCQDYHLAVRYIAEKLNICKPVLFSICLQDKSLKTLKSIVNILQEKIIF